MVNIQKRQIMMPIFFIVGFTEKAFFLIPCTCNAMSRLSHDMYG